LNSQNLTLLLQFWTAKTLLYYYNFEQPKPYFTITILNSQNLTLFTHKNLDRVLGAINVEKVPQTQLIKVHKNIP
jgi:hypothetical protein